VLAFLVALWSGGPCGDLPLSAGRSWTYSARISWTSAGSAASRDTTIAWTTRVLDARVHDSAQVAVVLDWPTALAWWEPGQRPDTSLLICVGARIYRIAGRGGSAALVDSLLAGQRRASVDDLLLRLPLHTGDLYGRERSERTDTFYAWYVESASPVNDRLARMGARAADSVYTVVYRTLPDHQIVDYAPGLGLTRYVYGHHGTVAAASAVLLRSSGPP